MRRPSGIRHLYRATACGFFAARSLALAAPDAPASPDTPAPFHGALTQQVNLYDLATRADTIVHAHVVSARVEAHPGYRNIATVLVTLRVETSLKGEVLPNGRAAPSGEDPSLMTFRQFIWDPRDRENGGGYRKGQELLLFLTRPSDIGLSAPVGLDQGRIPIEHFDASAPAVGGPIADRLMRDFAPSLASHGIVLPAQDRTILARATGRPLSLRDIGTLIRAVNRPGPLSPVPAAPEDR